MLVKATVDDTETSLSQFCNGTSEAKSLFSLWMACGRDADKINKIQNIYHPSDV